LYYLLKNNNELIQKSYRGTAQKVISKTNLKLIKVPIPTIERQQEIVKNIEELNDENTKLQEKIKENINKTKQIMKGIVKTIINDTEPIDEVQNEIVSVEEEVIIEPKPKVKKIVKKVKKPLVIVEEDNEV